MEMTAASAQGMSDLKAFRDMNSTDLNMITDGCWLVQILRSLQGYSFMLACLSSRRRHVIAKLLPTTRRLHCFDEVPPK